MTETTLNSVDLDKIACRAEERAEQINWITDYTPPRPEYIASEFGISNPSPPVIRALYNAQAQADIALMDAQLRAAEVVTRAELNAARDILEAMRRGKMAHRGTISDAIDLVETAELYASN